MNAEDARNTSLRAKNDLASKAEKDKENERKRKDEKDRLDCEITHSVLYPKSKEFIRQAASAGLNQAIFYIGSTVDDTGGLVDKGEILKGLLEKDGYKIKLILKSFFSEWSGCGDDRIPIETTRTVKLEISW